jgi:hypothetical protein
MRFSVAATGNYEIRLPQWGRSFWQDPNDGELFLAFSSGNNQVAYITSADSGNNWTSPSELFPVDDFSIHNNFDTFMDKRGHIHCGFRYNDSGCYRFVGKQGGGGWTLSSGSGPLGFNIAGDSGNVKGFDGSLVVQEAANSFTSEAASHQFPAVKIAAKASGDAVHAYILGLPYTGTPSVETTSSFDLSHFVGQDGGFPTITTNSATLGVDNTSEYYCYNARLGHIRGFSKQFGGTYFDNTFLNTLASGDIGYGPNMAIGSGYGIKGSDGLHLICTASGQSMYMSAGDGFGGADYQHVTTAYSDDLSTRPDANIKTDGTDVRTWRKIPRLLGTPSGQGSYLPMETGIAPTGNVYGVGRSSNPGSGVPVANFPGGGTNCDWMINDEEEIIFYFQGIDTEGRQGIRRIKGSHDFAGPKWNWPSLSHAESGVKHVAPTSSQFTGGYNNILFWGGFKAAKHPSEPGDGSNKGEFLVTQGWTATSPSGGSLVVWNVAESPTVLNPYSRPTYHLDYMATSGAPGINVFQGITATDNYLFASHVGQAANYFDGDLGTYGNVRNGYTVEIELDKPREVNRLEMLSRTLTRPPEVTVSGSFDGITWTRVLTKPSGKLADGDNEGSPLYKFSTTRETIVDRQNRPSRQPTIHMDAFVAKYVRFMFQNERGGASSRIYDLRLWGPGATEPETIRYSHDNSVPDPHDIRTVYLRKNFAKRVESFNKYQQGDLPSDFRSYGDFQWRVVGSGDAVRRSPNPNAPAIEGQDGRIPADSGIWGYYGHKRGYQDGFSLRSEPIGDASGLGNPLGPVPAGGILPGHSGVVEVDLLVTNDEVDDTNTQLGRQISFRIRTDTQRDDRVEFWTIAPATSNSDIRVPVLRDTWEDANNWDATEFKETSPTNYKEKTYTLNNTWGRHTLRWVYIKGAYDSQAEQANSPNFGTCWIDMVSGIDASPSNYVKGYMRGDSGFVGSSVSGILTGKAGQVVRGYTIGAPQISSINGYLISAVFPDISMGVNGYLLPNNESTINGFMFGGDGLASIPTGSIHGFIAVPDSGVITTVNGYVEGDWGQVIHGYVHGFESTGDNNPGNQVINGFVYGINTTSQIYGILGSENTVVTQGSHGYLNARFGQGDQIIHGYIGVPSGGIDDIKGVVLGWEQGPSFFRDPQTMIYGYIKTPIDETSGNVNGYLIAQLPYSQIYGYMGSEALVPSGGGVVAGGPGGAGGSTSNVIPGTNWVHGFISASGGDQVIHGYLAGPPGAVALIGGYALAGGSDDTIHGYTIGHETSATGIYGYISGVGFESSQIHGYMAAISGSPDDTIYGILTGVEAIDEGIIGHLIGIPSGGANSCEVCESHSFPLVAVPTVVIPSSCFF